MTRKIKFLFNKIISSKFFFKNPNKKQIVLFDCEVHNYYKNLFPKKICFILSTRSNKIDEIYISKEIVLFLVKNFFKRSVKKNYLIILIKLLNPKIVYTLIDNSYDFYEISRLMENETKFIAIQQSSRNETRWLPARYSSNIYLPTYYCMSEFDKNYYLKKTNVKNIIISGSLKSSLALNYIKSKNIKINKKKFDICVVSEPYNISVKDRSNKHKSFKNRSLSEIKDADHISKIGYSSGQVAIYAYKFCKKFNLKMIIAGRCRKDTMAREQELSFYRNYLKTDDFTLEANEPEKFGSFIIALQSRIIIGSYSTLLREVICVNKKIFVCNYSGHSDLDFVENKLKKFSSKKN